MRITPLCLAVASQECPMTPLPHLCGFERSFWKVGCEINWSTRELLEKLWSTRTSEGAMPNCLDISPILYPFLCNAFSHESRNILWFGWLNRIVSQVTPHKNAAIPTLQMQQAKICRKIWYSIYVSGHTKAAQDNAKWKCMEMQPGNTSFTYLIVGCQHYIGP